MGQHLYSFRQGWQSENLARFLLSHFSFLAQPSTVADDTGNDFYCTLFKKERVGTNSHLIPRNSFAIQVKSNTSDIDFTDKAAFLEQLELPFFIGVVNRTQLSMQIYSGRALDLIFALKGVPKIITVKLVPEIVDKNYYKIISEQDGNYELNFPLLDTISGKENLENEAVRVYSLLADECALIQKNIASRRMEEYILGFGMDDLRIIAGPRSATKFRQNFFYRLAEVFYNFEWAIGSNKNTFSKDEFSKYEVFWKNVRPFATTEDAQRVDKIYNKLLGVIAS